MSFNVAWPWIGVMLAAVVMTLLFFTRFFCAAGAGLRWHDPAWLSVLALPLYMFHQFEEHGVDLAGVSHALRPQMCGLLGYAHAASCPIPMSFFTAANVGSVWGAALLAVMLGRRRPVIALSAYGIALVNALTHIGVALWRQTYNPGLLTAMVVLLPAGWWALRVGLRAGIGRRGVAAIVVGGVLTHAVLIGSLLTFLHGLIGASELVAIQIVNMGAPLAAVFAFCWRRNASAETRWSS